MTAANARLTKANQSAPLWTVNGSAYNSNGTVIQMAGLTRQIRPNDYIVFTAPDSDPQLVKVSSATDIMGDACSGGSPTSVTIAATNKPTPIPVLHTQLTLASGIGSWLSSAGTTAVSVLFGWVEVGTLIDQPPQPWDGYGRPAGRAAGAVPVRAARSSSACRQRWQRRRGLRRRRAAPPLSVTWPSSTPVPLSPELQPPSTSTSTCSPCRVDKPSPKKSLGSGDATQTGQSFKLAKSPVTYLATRRRDTPAPSPSQ